MRFSALLFDAYGTLFDVYSVTALAEQLFPGKGEALSRSWRQKQLEYSWLRTLSQRYKPFLEITEDALDYAAAQLKLSLDDSSRARLMKEYACLAPYPETRPALMALREMGLRLAILSNGTPAMLDVATKSAGIRDLFEHLISVDAVRQYKTAPAAYRLGTDTLGCRPEQVLFVSSNAWDVSGASQFGYPTFWINRTGAPFERLDVTPTATGSRLSDLVAFAGQHVSAGTPK